MTRPYGTASSARALGCAALLALLAACASQGPTLDATQEAARYAARARGNYIPPGPPDDPWGPYVRKAASRFDIPDLWIRAVMNAESGGQEYLNGQLITSPAGAMGLMQVMPQTYDELRERYDLGPDPFDPRDNILAGAAYLREMYDIYGSPGFLAAYNAGPHRLDDYLSNERPLPAETRHYVAMIAPVVAGIYPAHRSPAEAYAMNQLPADIPGGLRYGRVQLASSRTPAHPSRHRGETRLARLPEPPQSLAAPHTQLALAAAPPTPHGHHGGFRLIQTANAEPAPTGHGGATSGAWAVQVGAFGRQGDAQAAVSLAKTQARSTLGVAHPIVASVHAPHASSGHALLWRARLTGLSREAAVKACAALSHSHKSCIVLSPEAQS